MKSFVRLAWCVSSSSLKGNTVRHIKPLIYSRRRSYRSRHRTQVTWPHGFHNSSFSRPFTWRTCYLFLVLCRKQSLWPAYKCHKAAFRILTQTHNIPNEMVNYVGDYLPPSFCSDRLADALHEQTATWCWTNYSSL